MNRRLRKLLNSSHEQRECNVEGWQGWMPRQFPHQLDPMCVRFANYRKRVYGVQPINGADDGIHETKLPGGGWTPIPNWFLDDIMTDSQVPDSVKRVFLYLYRQTVGWHRKDWEISLTAIEGATYLSRVSASYAVKVLTECWGLFVKVRGKKGQHSSTYRYSSPTTEQIFDRCLAVRLAYGLQRGCPGRRHLLKNPCTREVLNTGYAKLRQIRVGPGATYDEFFPD